MVLNAEIDAKLQHFIEQSSFVTSGVVITDLDGTAVHEFQGKIAIPKEVELGLMRHYERGRPLILNSLRFPLSVIRTFGQDWYRLSNAPIPTVTLNGSLMGFVKKNEDGELVFEEALAFPLTNEEIVEALKGVKGMLDGGIKNILVFYYPRDWRIGEVIWTPVAENVQAVKEKYASASAVTAVEFPKLQDQMLTEEICMIFLLIDAPEDQLMAYQHTKRSNFITHKGVDKLFGAQAMAKFLQSDLRDSLGAGDTELDSFLSGVGLACLVGNQELAFRGLVETIKLRDSMELGAVLFRAAELAAGRTHG
ncbi:MAG TPA: HAD hydrolase family protein [Pyrinomonadaceae bacterium]|nr:HAD hydrolase family protein [Pyrinomonadaceae bacterium]